MPTRATQFYTEVMDSVQTLDTGRRSAYDPDELDEEQREREQRNKARAAAAAHGLTKQLVASKIWHAVGQRSNACVQLLWIQASH